MVGLENQVTLPVQPRLPKMGDPFRMDGFQYLLTTSARRWNEDGSHRGTWQRFQRPLGSTPSHDDPERLNFQYKREGKVNQQELVWYDPALWHAALERQVRRLEADPWLPVHLKLWARGAYQAMREHYQHAGATWALPEKHLLKPALYGGKVVACASVQEAYRLAHGVLTNRFYLTTPEVSGTAA